ncbi:MAG TPA: hypothetical protein VN493_01380 [Thermoanaerobaculia bacterium]|nr:hypothetical protein [Thermoanaerobaculia bacterium]
MKRMVLVLSLTLAALGLLTSPAIAETKVPQVARILSAADRAFLASLAAMPLAPASAAKGPEVGTLALCTAIASCGTYNISCQGNNSTTSCTAVDRNCPQKGHVTCDGVTTWCNEECEGCEPGWCDNEAACASSCFPCDYTYTCNETHCFDRCKCIFATCPV